MHEILIRSGKIEIIIDTTDHRRVQTEQFWLSTEIHGISAEDARAMAADLLKAAEALDPVQVKIERWLTAEDVAQHGERWQWCSKNWPNDVAELTAVCHGNKVSMVNWKGYTFNWQDFSKGDYFTPIKS